MPLLKKLKLKSGILMSMLLLPTTMMPSPKNGSESGLRRNSLLPKLRLKLMPSKRLLTIISLLLKQLGILPKLMLKLL